MYSCKQCTPNNVLVNNVLLVNSVVIVNNVLLLNTHSDLGEAWLYFCHFHCVFAEQIVVPLAVLTPGREHNLSQLQTRMVIMKRGSTQVTLWIMPLRHAQASQLQSKILSKYESEYVLSWAGSIYITSNPATHFVFFTHLHIVPQINLNCKLHIHQLIELSK